MLCWHKITNFEAHFDSLCNVHTHTHIFIQRFHLLFVRIFLSSSFLLVCFGLVLFSLLGLFVSDSFGRVYIVQSCTLYTLFLGFEIREKDIWNILVFISWWRQWLFIFSVTKYKPFTNELTFAICNLVIYVVLLEKTSVEGNVTHSHHSWAQTKLCVCNVCVCLR